MAVQTWLSVLYIALIPSFLQAQDAVESKPITIEFVADRNYPPLMFVEGDTLKGFLIEIVHAVDSELADYNINISASKWQTAKAKIKRGNALGIIGPYFRGHEWEYMYPYSYPIMYEVLVTVCNKDTLAQLPAEATWPDDYRGLKIGTVGAYGGWLDSGIDYEVKGMANFFEFPDAAFAIQGVENDVVNCTLFEQGAYTAVKEKAERAGAESLNAYLGTIISYHSIHIGYSQTAIDSQAHPYARDFIKSFDLALFKLLRSGKLTPIYEKYGVAKRFF